MILTNLLIRMSTLTISLDDMVQKQQVERNLVETHIAKQLVVRLQVERNLVERHIAQQLVVRSFAGPPHLELQNLVRNHIGHLLEVHRRSALVQHFLQLRSYKMLEQRRL